jgi:hypothetical protein
LPMSRWTAAKSLESGPPREYTLTNSSAAGHHQR